VTASMFWNAWQSLVFAAKVMLVSWGSACQWWVVRESCWRLR
jgi:hypothetical protein